MEVRLLGEVVADLTGYPEDCQRRADTGSVDSRASPASEAFQQPQVMLRDLRWKPRWRPPSFTCCRGDGSAKRVQLTSGDHSGPKGKKAKKPRVSRPDRAQRKAAASRAWTELFDRLREVKQREQARADPSQE